MPIYRIYKLLFPGGEVYIGKTKLKLTDRFGGQGSNYTSAKVRAAIDKYGWENIKVFILHDNITNEEACILESKEIEKCGGINHPLVLNGTSGGDKGFTISKELSERISKGVKEYRKIHPTIITDEMKIKISETLKEYYDNNPDRIKEISEQKKNMYKEHPEKCKEISERNSIPVDQYSYDGKTLIASYKSHTEAALKTGLNKANIAKCSSGQVISIGGFRWKIHGKKYPIMQYDKRYKIENLGIDTDNKEHPQ